ncbi:naked cuticle-like protein 3 [Hypomesus transpacificus]|uniref:naked cuticle-like protein 3 n=1 Tax=Hypomesus transpacificus TaxID=137520 RepID=UPI001F077EC3|nr:naked cuticle-like protein 3 [Hypomesus transpacificus]
MGKLQSKHECKRRLSPEGGSFAANALTCQGEPGRITTSTHAIKRKQEFCGKDLKDTHIHTSDCHLEVALPLERGGDREHNHSHTVSDLPHQEWIFTLCFDNSGKVTKEGMSRLMHSIYEGVETSIKQPTNGSTALRVKLVLTPVSQSDRLSQSDHDTSHTQEVGKADRKYCVDENIDRRNHYLDLPGIENYSSKFDDKEAPSQEPEHVHSAHQRCPVGVRENCSATKSQGRDLSFLKSLRGKVVGGGGGGTKSTRFHGQWPQPKPQPTLWPQPQPALQYSRIKRFRSRAQKTAGSPSRPQLFHHQPPGPQAGPPVPQAGPPGPQAGPPVPQAGPPGPQAGPPGLQAGPSGLQAGQGEGREVFPSQPASNGGLVSLAQRHHLHHHKHHHHHYHYPPT